MLVNLPQTVASDDGASITFAASGAPVASASTEQMTVFGTGGASTSAIAPELWYAPDVATAAQYFSSIMDLSASELATLTGVKIYEVMLQAPDSVLSGFFSFLRQHGLKLSVEALPLVADPGQPGYGVESFGASGDLVNLISRIKTLGGDLASVAWDEPWAYGHVQTGLYTVEGVAAAVAAAQRQVQSIFPAVEFGDIEPVAASTEAASDLAAWFAAYKAAVGHDLDFFQADPQFWSPQWESGLAGVLSVARSQGIATSVIVDGVGNSTTATPWATQTVARAALLMADPALRPGSLVIQSWQATPSMLASPTTAGTLASVASDVAASAAAALQISAVATYSPNGLLSNVIWTGGYRAINDGTSLRFISSDGTTVLQSPWSQVSHFSFDPNTSTVTVVATTDGVASAQTVTVHSDGFHFAVAAQPVVPASLDPLFDVAWYETRYPQVVASGLSPYQHYMTIGWTQGLDPDPFFSTSYYLANNPDVAASGINPLQHFEQYGWREGRNPSASFDVGAYYRENPALPAGTNPLADYLSNLQSSGLLSIAALTPTFSASVQAGNVLPPYLLPSVATLVPVATALVPSIVPAASASSTPSNIPQEIAPVTPATIADAPSMGQVIRYFDSMTGTQFCTASTSEQDVIAAQRPDLVPEGLAFHTVTGTTYSANTEDVFRFFDRANGSHLFTASAIERTTLLNTNPDLVDEGTVFREYTTPTTDTEPVYRYFETRYGTHFYTSSQVEMATIEHSRSDLVFEGISFYAPKC